MKTLRIKLLSENATIPTRNNPTDSGLDLYAAEDVIIEPGATAIVKTDIAIELASGYEAQIRPRSGVTSKSKLRVQLGTVDADYRGNVGIIVDNIAQDRSWIERVFSKAFFWFNTTDTYSLPTVAADVTAREVEKYPAGTYKIFKGDKLAQLVVVPIELPSVEVVDELNDTARGDNGFGSSGTGA